MMDDISKGTQPLLMIVVIAKYHDYVWLSIGEKPLKIKKYYGMFE
jgi:hypothetical protein